LKEHHEIKLKYTRNGRILRAPENTIRLAQPVFMPGSEQGETMVMDRTEIGNIMRLRIAFLFLLGVLLTWGWINQQSRFNALPKTPSR